MSFRIKTMLFIGITEALFLLLLLWQSLAYLEHSGEEALYKRANETTHLFSLLAKNAVISSDIAALDEITTQIAELADVRYIRVVDSIGILAEAGDTSSLKSGFIEDIQIKEVDDGIFDAQTLVTESGIEFAKVQVGLPVDTLVLFIAEARHRLFSIALAELIMVALVSLILGRYLTKGLLALQKVALSVTKGDMSSRVDNDSEDELGITAKAFNVMLDKINTDQRKLNENAVNLTKSKEIAEKASQAKSRFLSQMSHEIRSPMNAVLGAVNLVAEKITEPPEHIHLLKTAQSSGVALLGVVNEILDFSKIEAGHMALKYTKADLPTIVEDVLYSAEAKSTNNKLTILGDISPECVRSIITDPARLRQIFNILVDNACKFTHEGVVLVTLDRIKLENGNEALQVHVKDSGIGIREEYLTKIFNEFEQVDSTLEASASGTGLGLNIAKGLVELMDGSIGVNSVPSQGSDFYFTLPMEFVTKKSLIKTVFEGPMVLVSNNISLRAAFAHKMQQMEVDFYEYEDITLLREQANSQLLSSTAIWLLDDTIIVNESNYLWLESTLNSVSDICFISGLSSKQVNAYVDFTRINKPLFFHKLCDSNFNNNVIPQKKSQLAGIENRDAIEKTVDEENNVKNTNPSINSSDSRNKNKTNILLVDDMEANRFIAGETLKNRGFEVSFACNGIEALEVLETKVFDVVLMDIRMPKMNGIDAVKSLKAGNGINKNTPIIAMTANVEKSEMERCKAAGMEDFVGKPFKTQVLVDSINRCIYNAKITTKSDENDALNKDDILSIALLNSLVEDISQEAVLMLADLFITDIEERSQLMKEALDKIDIEGLGEHAHALKSSAGSLGAIAMHQFCTDLEKASLANDFPKAQLICKNLNGITESTLNAYKNFIVQHSPDNLS